MNKKFGHIKKVVQLSPEKKNQLWMGIESKINLFEKNVRINDSKSPIIGEAKKTSRILYYNNKKMFISIITGLSILFGGTASYAAESSLPGQLLYPIKVHVNESIQSAFTFGSEDEAELQLELIEERIEEKNKLKTQGKLTAELDSQINLQIGKHQERYEEETETLEQNEEKSESVKMLDIRLNTILSSGLLNSQTNTSIQGEKSQKNEGEKTSSNIQTEAKVESSSNIELDIQSNVGDMIQTINEVGNHVEAEINETVESSIKIKNDVEGDIEVIIDETTQNLLNTIENINVESDTSISNNTETQTSSNNSETTTHLENNTQLESENTIEAGDTSTQTNVNAIITEKTGIGIK